LDLSARSCGSQALDHLRQVEQVIASGVDDPEDVLVLLRTSGRSIGAAARLVGEFFEREGFCEALDDNEARAQARRARRVERLGPALQPAVEAFADHLLAGRRRARLIGGTGFSDGTVEARLADIASLADVLSERGIGDWAAVGRADIDAFLVANMSSRVATVRSFSAFARRRKIILVDPTTHIDFRSAKGFTGRVLLQAEQRKLLRRWTRSDVDPNERVAGLLSLLHGASSSELRHLVISDLDLDHSRIRLGRRPFPVPLDPITLAALTACLRTRQGRVTDNPHLIITKDSRMHSRPCSQYYIYHLFDPAGTSAQVLRQTRLVHLAHRADPRMLAMAFGLTEQGALHYMADSVDHEETAFRPNL